MYLQRIIFIFLSLLFITLYFSCKTTSEVVVTNDDLWIDVRERPAAHDELIILYREYPGFDRLSEREQVEWIFDHDNEYPILSEQVIVWNETYPDRYPWFWIHPRWVIWMNTYPHPEILFAHHETFCYHFVQLPSAGVYFHDHPAYVNVVNQHTTVNNYFIHNNSMRQFSKEEQTKNPQNRANQNHSTGINQQNHSAVTSNQNHSTRETHENHSAGNNKQNNSLGTKQQIHSSKANQKHSASKQQKKPVKKPVKKQPKKKVEQTSKEEKGK